MNILYTYIPKKLANKFSTEYTPKEYNDKYFYIPKSLSYEKAVDALVRQKYSVSAELAILRQRDSKVEEFKAYYDFVEACKVEAKKFIEIRTAWPEA